MARVANTTTVTIQQTSPIAGYRSYLSASVDGRPKQLFETPQATYALRGLDP